MRVQDFFAGFPGRTETLSFVYFHITASIPRAYIRRIHPRLIFLPSDAPAIDMYSPTPHLPRYEPLSNDSDTPDPNSSLILAAMLVGSLSLIVVLFSILRCLRSYCRASRVSGVHAPVVLNPDYADESFLDVDRNWAELYGSRWSSMEPPPPPYMYCPPPPSYSDVEDPAKRQADIESVDSEFVL